MMKRLNSLSLSVGILAIGGTLACGSARGQDAGGDPSTEIVGKMQVAVGQLTKLDTGKPTQTTQKQIVDKLDELIAQLEKECENCRGSRVNLNATKPRKTPRSAMALAARAICTRPARKARTGANCRRTSGIVSCNR